MAQAVGAINRSIIVADGLALRQWRKQDPLRATLTRGSHAKIKLFLLVSFLPSFRDYAPRVVRREIFAAETRKREDDVRARTTLLPANEWRASRAPFNPSLRDSLYFCEKQHLFRHTRAAHTLIAAPCCCGVLFPFNV